MSAPLSLNQPAQDTKDWHTPMNENFGDIEDAVNDHGRMAGIFFCHEQSSPNMTARVDPGYIHKDNTITEVAAQNIPTLSAPSTNDRIDRVVIDGDGNVSVIAGTEAASPTAPAIPVGKFPCAQIYLTPSHTEITNSDITDERVVGLLRGISVDDDGNIYNYGQKIVSKVGDFQLSASEAGKNVDCEKGTDLTITIPADSTDNLPIGYTVTLIQAGAGQVVLSPEGGVTLQAIDSATKTREQWAVATLYKRASDEWVLVGNIE